MADAADAERFHLGQFAGVQDETLGLDPLVEVLELVARVFGGVEGDDDGGLDCGRQKTAQTNAGHAVQKRLAVLGIASMACRQATFLLVLQQRFVQGGDHVGRWGEAPLAGLRHIGVLVEQVHRQGMAVALSGGQCLLLGKDEAHAGHAFEALARGGDQCVERHVAGINWQGAEGTHGVDDQALAVVLNDLGDLRQRIENAGAGFAVDQRDVGDARVGLEQTVHIGGGGGFVFSGFKGAEVAAQHFTDLRQALAVRAVDQDQHLAITRDQGADGRFDGKGAAALQGHTVVAVSTIEDCQQLLADAGSELVETVIPRTPVHHHGLTGAVGCGQGARGQQDRRGSGHLKSSQGIGG